MYRAARQLGPSRPRHQGRTALLYRTPRGKWIWQCGDPLCTSRRYCVVHCTKSYIYDNQPYCVLFIPLIPLSKALRCGHCAACDNNVESFKQHYILHSPIAFFPLSSCIWHLQENQNKPMEVSRINALNCPVIHRRAQRCRKRGSSSQRRGFLDKASTRSKKNWCLKQFGKG